MGLTPFVLISIFYAVIGVGVLRDLANNWRTTFDRRFTGADRVLVDKAAFFVLLPISVALHELGHAAAIWSLGGEVTDFGFYGFAGFVAYREPFTAAQQMLVALAGPLVNVVLSAGAIAAVLLRRPPMRAAFNELLVQFAVISGINALIVYPLLDYGTGLGGDWTQIYGDGVPALTAIIGAAHVAILGIAYWAWKNPRMQARFAALTGVPAGATRGALGGMRAADGGRPGRRPPGRRPPASPGRGGEADRATGTELVLREAASRVAGGWPTPVRVVVQRHGSPSDPGGAISLGLAWAGAEDGRPRAVVARPLPGGIELLGQAGPDGMATASRRVETLPAAVGADALTLALRLAMEEVERWATGSPVRTPR